MTDTTKLPPLPEPENAAESDGCTYACLTVESVSIGDLESARRQGWEASSHGVGGHQCPYAFWRFTGISQDEFDRLKRPLLDEWMRGWNAHRAGKTIGAEQP